MHVCAFFSFLDFGLGNGSNSGPCRHSGSVSTFYDRNDPIEPSLSARLTCASLSLIHKSTQNSPFSLALARFLSDLLSFISPQVIDTLFDLR